MKTLRLQFIIAVIDPLKNKYTVTIKKPWVTILKEPQQVFAFMLKEEEDM
jgi:hypothetical protein